MNSGDLPLLIQLIHKHAITLAQVKADADIADAIAKKHANTLDHSNANDPTSDQKAALAGTSGTPSASNKYVTDGDSRNSDSRTPSNNADLIKRDGSVAWTAAQPCYQRKVKTLTPGPLTGSTTSTQGLWVNLADDTTSSCLFRDQMPGDLKPGGKVTLKVALYNFLASGKTIKFQSMLFSCGNPGGLWTNNLSGCPTTATLTTTLNGAGGPKEEVFTIFTDSTQFYAKGNITFNVTRNGGANDTWDNFAFVCFFLEYEAVD